jgi:ribosomal protein S18 acetylase RimI-like enzyme
MAPTLELLPADQVDFRGFTSTLNTAYEDYFVPLNMSVDELRTRVLQDDIRLDLSCAARVGDQLVGLAMVARREERGWIGGVGVIPSHRGQGIGRKIMDYVLDTARKDGIKRVELEVITLNAKAKALYDSLNFQQVRLLHVAEGRPYIPDPPDTMIRETPVLDALAYHDSFHPRPVPWQRSLKAMRAMASQLDAYVVLRGHEVLAYGVGVFRSDAIRFVDLGHAPNDERIQGVGVSPAEALNGLVKTLHHRYPSAIGSIINISETDPAWSILAALDYKPHLSQYEMALEL